MRSWRMRLRQQVIFLEGENRSRKKKLSERFSTLTPYNSVIRRNQRPNIIQNTPDLMSLEDCQINKQSKDFYLFFEYHTTAGIKALTNMKIRDTLSSIYDADAVVYHEAKVFNALIQYQGLYRLSKHSTEILLSSCHEPAVFYATISWKSIEFLHSRICFDRFNFRKKIWQRNWFTAVREIFENGSEMFGKAVAIEDYIPLD